LKVQPASTQLASPGGHRHPLLELDDAPLQTLDLVVLGGGDRVGVELGIARPPVHPHLFGLVDRGDQEAHLRRFAAKREFESDYREHESAETETRRSEAALQGFQASPELSANLQKVLVDLIELHLQGKQAHWNVVGTNFRDLHLQLDELVDFAREASDTVAERMRALDAIPDGRSDTVAGSTTLPQFPAYEHSTTEVVDLVTARTYATVDTIRTVHDAVDAEDPSTADILHQLIDGLEKLAWLIKSENKKV